MKITLSPTIKNRHIPKCLFLVYHSVQICFRESFLYKKNKILPTEFDLEGKKILVIDDNPMNQLVIKMITKKWLNTTIDYSNNGLEGIRKLIKNHYDIILMDIQMPVMNGYETTTAIRNGFAGVNKKTIPIIALTADGIRNTKKEVLEIGMDNYLLKPVDKEQLFESIQKLV